MKKYRIVRTHKEIYVADGMEGDSPEDAIERAKESLSPDDYECVEQTEYEYEAIPEDELQ